MHLTLVDNLVLTDRRNLGALDIHPHLGLTSLAAVAQRDGHRVTIVDPKRAVRFGMVLYDESLYEKVAALLLADSPDAVGFTTLGCSFIFALRVAGYLKQAEPDLPILLGGPHATILDRPIMERFTAFDVLVRHEAEETLPAVLDGLDRRTFERVPGVTWRTRPGGCDVRTSPGAPMVVNLDELPIPAYELYPVADLGLTMMRVEAGRGCPFSCSFCSTASFFQRRYRLKSPGRIVEEMDRLNLRYGVTDFKLDHDMFTANRKAVLAFCEAVEPRGYTWNVSSRVDCVDAGLIDAMARAGCRGLYFGVETGSQVLQSQIKKRMDLTLLEPALEETERAGVDATVSLITGFPRERAEDQESTLDLAGQCFCRPGQPSLTQLHMLLPEPGTELFIELADQLRYDGYRTDFNARLLEEEDEALIRAHPRIFATYHHFPTELPREQHIFAVDATRTLFALGPVLLGYLLRYYSGRLSLLVSQWRQATDGSGAQADLDSLLRFLADVFGERHHISSLVRFVVATTAVAGSDARSSRDGAAVTAVAERQGAYTLSQRAVLLEDLHDCPALLARIADSQVGERPMTEAEAGERGCYVAIDSGRGDRAVINLPIERGLCALLRLFETPRRLDEMARFIKSLAPDLPPPDPRLFEQLTQAGILVAAGEGKAGVSAPPSPRGNGRAVALQ